MSRYLFASFAANYRPGQIFRHLFATGNQKDTADFIYTLEKHYDATEAILYSTGRAALAAAIRACVPAGSKVAISGLTCFAVPEAVHAADCTPVYLDVSTTDFNYSSRELLRTLAVHPDIKAVVVQNMLGLTTNITALEKIAKKRDIVIIEDLAHCTGAHYPDGREVGTVGSAAALSFGKGKSLDTVRGGAVILHSKPLRPLSTPIQLPSLADRLRDRFYPLLGGLTRALYHIRLGKPFTSLLFKLRLATRSADGGVHLERRLTHWQAALAKRQFDDLPATTKSRTLTAAKIITSLDLPPIPKGSAPLRVPLLVPDRDKILTKLRTSHIYFDDVWYDVPVSPRRYYSKAKFPESDCPTSVAISEHIINIPTFYSATQLTPALDIIRKGLK